MFFKNRFMKSIAICFWFYESTFDSQFSDRSDMSRRNIKLEIQKFGERIFKINHEWWFQNSIHEINSCLLLTSWIDLLILSFSNRSDMSLHNIKYEIQNFGERLFNINHEWWFQKSIHEINSDLLLISWIDFWFSFFKSFWYESSQPKIWNSKLRRTNL